MALTPFTVFTAFFLWLLFTKTVKLWPHFYRHPDQMKFIPLLIAFGYFHSFLKMYCLLTLHKVSLLFEPVNMCLLIRFPDLMGWRTIQASQGTGD